MLRPPVATLVALVVALATLTAPGIARAQVSLGFEIVGMTAARPASEATRPTATPAPEPATTRATPAPATTRATRVVARPTETTASLLEAAGSARQSIAAFTLPALALAPDLGVETALPAPMPGPTLVTSALARSGPWNAPLPDEAVATAPKVVANVTTAVAETRAVAAAPATESRAPESRAPESRAPESRAPESRAPDREGVPTVLFLGLLALLLSAGHRLARRSSVVAPWQAAPARDTRFYWFGTIALSRRRLPTLARDLPVPRPLAMAPDAPAASVIPIDVDLPPPSSPEPQPVAKRRRTRADDAAATATARRARHAKAADGPVALAAD